MFNVAETIHEVEVTPDSGKNTRLQNYSKMVKGLPEILPAKPKVTRIKGNKLRISGSHKISADDMGDGVVKGVDGRSFYYVINDPVNGEAAKLYVKESDVQIVRTGNVYTVKGGDSLVKIAKDFYPGNKHAVTMIYDANKGVIGNNPDLIYPGQTLFIPFNTH